MIENCFKKVGLNLIKKMFRERLFQKQKELSKIQCIQDS